MNGLKPYQRDRMLPALAGEAGLCPPAPADLLDLVGDLLAIGSATSPPLIGAELEYARWKPKTSITAGYRLSFADGSSRLIVYKRYSGEKATHIERDFDPGDRARQREDRLRSFAVLPRENLCLYAFPADRVLTGLSRLIDMQRTARLLSSLGLSPGLCSGGRLRWRRSQATLLRYKPERRAVFRLDLALRDERGDLSGRRLAARVLPPEAAGRLRVARSTCFGAATPRIGPLLIGVEERTGLVFEEWLDVDVPDAEDFASARAAGATLARLHALPIPTGATGPAGTAGGARDSPLDSPIDSSGASLFSIDARLAARASRIGPPPRSGPVTWTHGDLHPDQVARRRDDGETVLLDLDNLRPGSPVDDLASWIADALAADLCAGLEAAAHDLLEGYRANGGGAPLARTLRTRVANELVARAAAALRRLEAGAIDRARALLERAENLASEPEALRG